MPTLTVDSPAVKALRYALKGSIVLSSSSSFVQSKSMGELYRVA